MTLPKSAQAKPVPPSVADRAKKLLADPAKRIDLDALVNEVLGAALDALSQEKFPPTGDNPDKENFSKRIAAYEAAIADLLPLVILLARWGDEEGRLQLEKIIARAAETAPDGGGTVVWLRLRWYPVWMLIYAAGIAASAAQRHALLGAVLTLPVPEDASQASSPLKPVVLPASSRLFDVADGFKWLPGHEQQRVPLSEHLFAQLKPLFDEMLFLGAGYERHFDRFEVVTALVIADLNSREREGHIWAPPGRYVWKAERRSNPFTALHGEAEAAGAQWPPLAAGLFKGSLAHFQKVAEGFGKYLSRW
ncbi:hypothetical protein [Bradyrhizobium aeschynomenes]|uniref:hypothetical protein n=1 Tax=Bradyrhizobium aeschynomenes TaxID=2734909 RepID=UPI0015554D22|nr:hypothetical protein [Bradyrhizobium aeschynomenes]NPV20372.1 hypothetical protein [Bradyrhizobium aeschynomenes]